jgi:glycosyltransferase involved in cell wall biosynthesis
MDDVKVSVCMVTYNHDRYIQQSVESVLEQRTNFPIEIVIGEDGSTDNTPSILRELARQHPKTIRLRLAEQNEGGKKNFMGAFAACRGQYVAMLEGDDYWTSPNKLQLQADALDARPDWAICFHPAQCIYEDGITGPAHHPERWDKPEATLEDLLADNFIPTNAVMFRNRLFGALPPWFEKLTLGDWPLHILNAEHGNIGFLPEVMSAYRVHARSFWSSRSLGQKLIGIFEMLTAIDHHLKGRHAIAIDQFRLNTVAYLNSELEASKGRQQELVIRHGNNLRRAENAAAAEVNRLRALHANDLRCAEETAAAEMNRLRALHANDLRCAEGTAAAEMNRLRILQQQLLALEADYCLLKIDLVEEINRAKTLQQEIATANADYIRLVAERQVLKEFHDVWSRSITYRVAREVRRPVTQFLDYVRRITGRPDPPQPPSVHPASKAA